MKSIYKDGIVGRDRGPVMKLIIILISSPRDAKPWHAVLTPFSTAWIHE